MKILDNNYYYLTDRFKSKNGDIWRLSGTRTGETHHAHAAIDTFLNLRTREFQDIERIKVYEFQESGRIVGIENI